jgi:hypothetical protein
MVKLFPFFTLFYLSLIQIAEMLIKMQIQINYTSNDVQSTDVTHVPNKNLLLSREGIRINFADTSVPFVMYTTYYYKI